MGRNDETNKNPSLTRKNFFPFPESNQSSTENKRYPPFPSSMFHLGERESGGGGAEKFGKKRNS